MRDLGRGEQKISQKYFVVMFFFSFVFIDKRTTFMQENKCDIIPDCRTQQRVEGVRDRWDSWGVCWGSSGLWRLGLKQGVRCTFTVVRTKSPVYGKIKTGLFLQLIDCRQVMTEEEAAGMNRN